MTEFASQYPRNNEGHIQFPNDRTLRQDLFLEKVEHPAKNNLYVLDELANHLTNPGDVILDPMAGGGSIMYVAKQRRVICLEIEPEFIRLLNINKEGFPGSIVVIDGDCRKLLPLAGINAIIFSPPYSNMIKANKGMPQYDEEQRSIAKGIESFVQHPDNLSKLPDFWFNQAMIEVYQKCFTSLVPGGHMAIIIKDHIVKGKRVAVGTRHSQVAIRLGFELAEWHKREFIGGLFGAYNKKQGLAVVEDEDIIIFRRPE